MVEKTVYRGTFVHLLSLTDLEILHLAAVGVDSNGTIVFIDKDSRSAVESASRNNWPDDSYLVVEASRDGASFFFPGFFDTHIHASQYPNVGLFGKTTLLDWLNTYTFPLEASFKDLAIAQNVYSKVISRTLNNGTTTASYYATIHTDGTNLLADLALKAGQRAFIGRCCMTENSPDYYRDASVEDSQRATLDVINHISKIDPDYNLVRPIITPRFAPSCSRHLLEWLGQLSIEKNLPVQTHISENLNEVALVKSMHPFADSYADVYDKCDLLHDRTILAHAVHLTTEERDLIAERKSGVAHCPISNSALTSGEARVRWLLQSGIKVGLGTDVSGGYAPSILHTARQALLVSRHLAMKNDDSGGESVKLTIEEVLYLATLGGAQVCGLHEKLGNFVVGKQFDAQLITLTGSQSPVDVFSWENGKYEDLVAKWLFNGDDRNVLKVWVDGKFVGGTAF
ncbi:hypothetical protein V1514DRAFT_99471 [Lipomyces japonicus]|uniref:uncharacterized protein n=1 Tax=Lipomyces japonicus TaxID=56871 RepID=UPI0034CEBA36